MKYTGKSPATLIGILGGTFDPVHFGHLRLAVEVWQALRLDHVRFVPCKKPALKALPQASEAQRLQMLSLALHDQPHCLIDQRELQRGGTSFMVDTLQSLRNEFSAPLCLIVGSDVFAELTEWHNWQQLLGLAHIVVVHRPQFDFHQFPTVINDLLAKHQTTSVDLLHQQTGGAIFLQEMTMLDISASRLRSDIQLGEAVQFLLPQAVLEYVLAERIYDNN